MNVETAIYAKLICVKFRFDRQTTLSILNTIYFLLDQRKVFHVFFTSKKILAKDIDNTVVSGYLQCLYQYLPSALVFNFNLIKQKVTFKVSF